MAFVSENLKYATLALAFAVAAASPLHAQKAPKGGYSITGKVEGASGKIYLEEMTSAKDFAKRDSATVAADGSFTFTGKVEHPGLYRIQFGRNLAMLLPVENKAITVGGNLANLTGTAFSKGTEESDRLQQMRAIRSKAQEQMNKLNERYARIQQIPDSVNAIVAEAQRKQAQEAKELTAFVRANPKSIVGMYTAHFVLDADANFAFLDSMAAVYRKTLKQPQYANMLQQKVDKLRSTTVGGTAPDITLANPDGKVVPLSSLRGKYVLIDFWASWCGPCRKENPNVVRLYNQYKDKNFEIYGVSLDKDRDKWLKAIADDNLTWTHVSDLKFWQSEAAQLYNINSIPATVLLDPQGKIIAKNLRGQALEAKVAELLNHKN